jgi:cytochrome c oxidase subunit 1
MGHSSQQVNVAAHISCWYAIAGILFGAKPLSEKVSRMAFFLYILFLQLASAHHLLVDPGLSSEWKIFNTSYALYMAVLGSMIHGLTVPGSVEAAQRKRGYNKGMFEWLRKAPWGNPVFSGMAISVVAFGFLGGISGVVIGTEQLNLIMHNTIYVPGHFHTTVASGTTLAFMAMAYWLVPTLWQRELVGAGLAKWSPYLFGIGVSLMGVFQMGAGTLGAPRRHWDMQMSDAALGYDLPQAAFMMMGLNGISALVASLGAAIFIYNMVGTVMWGKAKGAPAPAAAAPTGAGTLSHTGSAEGVSVPGTFLLAVIFLVTFILYYFVNWKFLASVWPLH